MAVSASRSVLLLVLNAVPAPTLALVERLTGGSVRSLDLATVPRDRRLTVLWCLMVQPVDQLVVIGARDDPLDGLLLGLAGLARARRLGRLVGDTIVLLPRARALTALLRLTAAGLAGLAAMILCLRELTHLSRAPRRPARLGSGPVFYINPTPWRGERVGGAVAHTVGVIKGLVACGYAVDALSGVGDGLVPAAVRLYALPQAKVMGLPTEANLYRHHRRVVAAANMIAAAGPHGFIYQRLTLGTYPGVVLARRQGVPLVLEYNGSEVWIARNWGAPLRFEKLALSSEAICLRHADLIVTVSEPLRDELIAKGVESDRIVVQPNGVDPALFDPAHFSKAERAAIRLRFGVQETAFVVGFIGTFGAWHGAETLAEAARLLIDDNPERAKNLHFLFVGDGARRPMVEAALPAERYGAYRTFSGMVPQAEAPALLAACDLLVSPHIPNSDGSRFFGSPTKLFEYMASGKPIIASDLDQIGEVLAGSPSLRDIDLSRPPSTEACAVLVEPGHVGQLAQAIGLAVENWAWFRILGSRARTRAVERYSWEMHVRLVLRRLTLIFSKDGG